VNGFTRDTSLATGTQAVTGVGFKPSAIIFLALQNTTDEASIGIDDDVQPSSIDAYDAITADAWATEGTGGGSIVDRESSSNKYVGSISTFDSDGFTISWTRTNTPTGTLAVHYLALR